jgi:hypothetical protein
MIIYSWVEELALLYVIFLEILLSTELLATYVPQVHSLLGIYQTGIPAM